MAAADKRWMGDGDVELPGTGGHEGEYGGLHGPGGSAGAGGFDLGRRGFWLSPSPYSGPGSIQPVEVKPRASLRHASLGAETAVSSENTPRNTGGQATYARTNVLVRPLLEGGYTTLSTATGRSSRVPPIEPRNEVRTTAAWKRPRAKVRGRGVTGSMQRRHTAIPLDASWEAA